MPAAAAGATDDVDLREKSTSHRSLLALTAVFFVV